MQKSVCSTSENINTIMLRTLERSPEISKGFLLFFSRFVLLRKGHS